MYNYIKYVFFLIFKQVVDNTKIKIFNWNAGKVWFSRKVFILIQFKVFFLKNDWC